MQFLLHYSLALLGLLSLAFAIAPTVTIEGGTVIGTTTVLPSSTVTVNKFLGIPFAAPPGRFEEPVPPKPWNKALNATSYPPSCIQAFIYPKSFHDFFEDNFNFGHPPESEDCLYVNVFAPSKPSKTSGRAVMVFIYGGNFQFGNSFSLDGSAFATDEDVILVTFNYRTNVFGFPPPDRIPSKQNLGFLDQRLALQWVQKNIHSFGGDANKVLIFGQSAGAMSVDNMITSMPNNPPFHAAITQSGQYSYLAPGLLNSETFYWQPLIETLNCSNADDTTALDCLKNVPVDTLRSAVEVGEMLFYPAVDNVTMIYDPINARRTGKIAKVPIVGGNVAQEGPINVFGQDNLTAFLDQDFGAIPSVRQAVIDAYPRLDGETDNQLIARIFADFYFVCPQSLQLNASSAQVPTWRYYYNATAPPNTLPPSFPNLGIYHGLDVVMVFGLYYPFNITANEVALSRYLRHAWASFAQSPENGPGWNAIGTGSNFVIQDGSNNPIAVEPAPVDLDLGVIGGIGDVAGIEIRREAEVDTKCAVFTPIYQALASARGDSF